jgi:hypothetical protein
MRNREFRPPEPGFFRWREPKDHPELYYSVWNHFPRLTIRMEILVDVMQEARWNIVLADAVGD